MYTASTFNSPLVSLLDHKVWANEELFKSIAMIDVSRFSLLVHNATRILNHVYVVDQIFKAHLEGCTHPYTATNTKETPSLSALGAAAKATDDWYAAYVRTLLPSALQEPVRFVFTDGETGTMTREEMLLHVITHGGYHRGAAGQVMRDAEATPPRDLYTRFLHVTEPERRESL